MKILVLKGGNSAEREVSLRSAAFVAQMLTQAGHDVISLDTKDDTDAIGKYWENVDVVFPVLHGAGGEDGSIQEVLDKLGMKYVGATADVSRLCFDKDLFKQELVRLGIKTPQWRVVTRQSIENDPMLTKPYVLKPVTGGSSINTHIVRSPTETQLDLDAIFLHDEKMLLEKLIDGDEITVAVLGGQTLPVIEIIPPESGEFDYENKYNGKTQELCPPANIDAKLQEAAQSIAVNIHNALQVRHLSRVDFMIKNDELFALELNTLPGFTEQSLFPKAALTAGISMPELVDRLVRQAAQ